MNTLFPPFMAQISRREFLRLTQRSLLGLFSLPLLERAQGQPRILRHVSESDHPKFGRAVDNQLQVLDQPSFAGKLVNMYWRDLVFPIEGVTVGDKEPAHNRIWYVINDGAGYVHSGSVQPVDVRPNLPLAEVSAKGVLAEVTVPYTDAIRHLNRPERPAYRLYYRTTHWLKARVSDEQDQAWYLIEDDKYKTRYYVQAEHLRPLGAEDLDPLSPEVPPEFKRLEVRLQDQLVIAYEENRPVFMTRTASGARFRRGDFSTPAGYYLTNRKRPSRHMASGDLAAPDSYDLPGVPWVSYLTLSGISFHGTYWHNDFGKPRSHGCLNLTPEAAQWIYRWTTPGVPPEKRTYTEPYGTFTEVLA